MVQGVITRMGGNSAQIKTWSVSIVTAVFVFSGLSGDPHWLTCLGGGIAVVAFWLMDAEYLRLERCYVKLYEAVATGEKVIRFSLDYRPYETETGSILKVMWSRSIWRFYLTLLIVIFLLAIFIFLKEQCYDTQSFLQLSV